LYITNITTAYARVVLKLPVGGRKPGNRPRILENRITKKEVANSGKYVLAAFFEPKIPVSRFSKKSIERISKIFVRENFSPGRTESDLEILYWIFLAARKSSTKTISAPNI
jgi:hypothetical protein